MLDKPSNWSWLATEAFLTCILAGMGHFLPEVPQLLDMSEAFPCLSLEEMEAAFLWVGEQWCVYACITPGQVLSERTHNQFSPVSL